MRDNEEQVSWTPKTELGKAVFGGAIKSIDEIFSSGSKIKEPEIVDWLLPNMKTEIILIGGSPGKGGGIRRTPTRRTARMHRSGRRFTISAMVIVGNENGYIGVGKSEAKENRTAIQKATQVAKLNIMPIMRGCGSWECGCGEEHSIPQLVRGKSGSVIVMLKPAPRGIGLCCSGEMKKMMRLAGVQDIWTKTYGERRTRSNLVMSTLNAFKNLNRMKM
jgi:small subunit ribosomal protein S5